MKNFEQYLNENSNTTKLSVNVSDLIVKLKDIIPLLLKYEKIFDIDVVWDGDNFSIYGADFIIDYDSNEETIAYRSEEYGSIEDESDIKRVYCGEYYNNHCNEMPGRYFSDKNMRNIINAAPELIEILNEIISEGSNETVNDYISDKIKEEYPHIFKNDLF